MSKKTILIIIALIALIAFFAIGKNQGWIGSKNNYKKVQIENIEKKTIVEKVSATGKIQPEKEVKISSEVSGEIIALPIKEGQSIKKGDLLAKINPDLYQSGVQRSVASLQNISSMLEQSNASLKEAEANYNRNKTLFDKGIISKSEWDRVVSAFEVAKAAKQSSYYNVQSAKASVKEAKDNLGRTIIYSPISGTISKLDVELGERVVGTQQMAGTEIMRIANLNNMEVEVDVNENDIVKININDLADVEVDAFLKKKFKGKVTEIANTANSVTSGDQVTNFKVKVRILEESYKNLLKGKPANYSPFKPGMTATVDIITETKKNIVAIPISAVVMKTDTMSKKNKRKKEKESTKKTKSKKDEVKERKECVFVKIGEKAEIRIVETGIQDNENIEILKGLKANETLVVGPYQMVSRTLENGDFIEEENEDDDEKNNEKD